ncbi:SAM-dependent methyltransferase [Sphaerisporangium album]|nr:SAM-dependent methyltransferase [Sphaerisporangium album]
MIDRYLTASRFLPSSRQEELDAVKANADRPSIARIHNCLLGGKDNYSGDRDAAERILKALPGAGRLMKDNRAFVLRAARFCASAVDQIVDLAPGMPGEQNVDEVAREVNPAITVVGVDDDPVVLAHSRARRPGADFLWGDVRAPERVIHDLEPFVDFDRPVALMATTLLQFVTGDPRPILRAFRERMAPGSLLVISHGTGDGVTPDALEEFLAVYAEVSSPAVLRTVAEISALFEGLKLLYPGVVDVQEWWPDGIAEPVPGGRMLGGVGRVPSM